MGRVKRGLGLCEGLLGAARLVRRDGVWCRSDVYRVVGADD